MEVAEDYKRKIVEKEIKIFSTFNSSILKHLTSYYCSLYSPRSIAGPVRSRSKGESDGKFPMFKL